MRQRGTALGASTRGAGLPHASRPLIRLCCLGGCGRVQDAARHCFYEHYPEFKPRVASLASGDPTPPAPPQPPFPEPPTPLPPGKCVRWFHVTQYRYGSELESAAWVLPLFIRATTRAGPVETHLRVIDRAHAIFPLIVDADDPLAGVRSHETAGDSDASDAAALKDLSTASEGVWLSVASIALP